VWLRASERISVRVRALGVFPRVGTRSGGCSISHSISSLTKTSPTARLQRGPRWRAISGRRSSSLHRYRNARQIARRGAIVSGANPISVFPETAAARATSPAPQGRHVRACTASNGSDGGRADRRSLTRIKQVRGRNAPPPSDLDIETKKPAADIPRGRTKLVSMMSVCRCFARRVKPRATCSRHRDCNVPAVTPAADGPR